MTQHSMKTFILIRLANEIFCIHYQYNPKKAKEGKAIKTKINSREREAPACPRCCICTESSVNVVERIVVCSCWCVKQMPSVYCYSGSRHESRPVCELS